MYTLFDYKTDTKTYPGVDLDEYYREIAYALGDKRQKGAESKYNLDLNIVENAKETRPHVVGAGSEIGCLLIKGVSFNPTINTWNSPDAGICEIRFNGGYDPGHSFAIKKTDSDDTVIISMGGDFPRFVCFGFNYIRNLRAMNLKMKFKEHKDPKVEFSVPRNLLLPIELLNPACLDFNSPLVELQKLKAQIHDMESVMKKYGTR
jgi:hypothetical protein